MTQREVFQQITEFNAKLVELNRKKKPPLYLKKRFLVNN